MIDPEALRLFRTLLDFCEEKTIEARNDATSQVGAISEAAGYVRCVSDQLADELLLTQIALVWEFATHANWWSDVAKADRVEFMDRSAVALAKIDDLRNYVIGPAQG